MAEFWSDCATTEVVGTLVNKLLAEFCRLQWDNNWLGSTPGAGRHDPCQSHKPKLSLPDHMQLPESDGICSVAKRAGGKNFQEHPQSLLLTDSILSVLKQLHPDGYYAIGQDSGIGGIAQVSCPTCHQAPRIGD